MEFGRWLIDGYPKVVLFDLGSAAWKLNDYKHELAEYAGIRMPSDDQEANEAVIFGGMVAHFLQKVNEDWRQPIEDAKMTPRSGSSLISVIMKTAVSWLDFLN